MYNYSQTGSDVIMLMTANENTHALVKSSLSGCVAELHHVNSVDRAVHLIDLLVPDLIIIDAETFSRDSGQYKQAFIKKQDILKISVLLIGGKLNDTVNKWLNVEEIITGYFSPVELTNRVQSLLSIRKLRNQIDLRNVVAMQIVSQGEFVKDRNKILLIDDNKLDRLIIKKFFEQSKYDIVEATSGEEALGLICRENFDIILLDIVLPEISGFEVCRNIKNNPSTSVIPVVVLTGLNNREDKIKALQYGADDFLTKPINKRELLVRVEVLLKRKHYQEQILKSFNSALSQAITDSMTQL